METKKYYRPILILAIIVSLCSLFWLYWTIGRTIFTLEDDGLPLREGYETWQIAIITGYSIFAIVLVAIQMIFVIKQLKSIRNGILFDKSNVKYILTWGIIWVFYDFCAGNIGQMIYNEGFNEITIHGTLIGIPTIAITFAILYKMAADVATENNLTI
ncbi:MAG: hypothetical protein IJN66_07845 [Muribaculaceae bacterium]|nr:hypothetical protein [Muribaculaceae bacterium]